MTDLLINEVLQTPEYEFLLTHPQLKGRLLFVTFGGSHAYGTNIPGSDVDMRGCALNSPSDLLGLTNFEAVLDDHTDTTIYSFNKLISLLLNVNPNTIEMLGCRPEHYAMVHPLGQRLIDARRMFLSKRAVKSFGGYASQQLRRLQNALARDSYPQPEKEAHILQSCEAAAFTFPHRYASFSEEQLRLHLAPSDSEDRELEIVADVQMKAVPLRQFVSISNELTNVLKDYDQLNTRNRKKDDAHLCKHMMHLIRLHLMCLDILEKEEIITFREADRPLLISIRRGDYLRDGRITPEFTELLHSLEQRLNYAKEQTSLPEDPDFDQINDFVVEINREALNID